MDRRINVMNKSCGRDAEVIEFITEKLCNDEIIYFEKCGKNALFSIRDLLFWLGMSVVVAAITSAVYVYFRTVIIAYVFMAYFWWAIIHNYRLILSNAIGEKYFAITHNSVYICSVSKVKRLYKWDYDDVAGTKADEKRRRVLIKGKNGLNVWYPVRYLLNKTSGKNRLREVLPLEYLSSFDESCKGEGTVFHMKSDSFKQIEKLINEALMNSKG